MAGLEAAHRQEAEDRDQQVASGIGFGLAALVVSAIALGWSRFRASGAVRRLSDLDRGRAIGLCVLGGLVLLLTGGGMSGGGSVVASLGTFLALLGIALPACLLMARHSVRAEGGGGAPSPAASRRRSGSGRRSRRRWASSS